MTNRSDHPLGQAPVRPAVPVPPTASSPPQSSPDAAAVAAAGPPAAHPAGSEPTGSEPTNNDSRLIFVLQIVGSIVIIGGAVLYWMFVRGSDEEAWEAESATPTSLTTAVQWVGPSQIAIDPASSLAQKLVTGTVQRAEITTPQLRVTGAVAASLRPVGPDSTDQWQFNDPEALAAFYEWRRANVDAQFADEQTERMTRLHAIQRDSKRQIAERLRRLVDAGTDTLADLQLAEADLLQADIEGRQAIHEAESDLRRASQEVAVSSRQLQLMGLDVEMLEQASADVDLIVAEVPEDYLSRVRIGQRCEARFHGFPRQTFPGIVQRISPTLSLERRALRVLFFVDDPNDQLRPGMFADIGLGTEPREAILVPAEAVIHVGRYDYVFARPDRELAPGDNLWQLVAVEVGDSHQGVLEVLDGLDPGREIISQGAILLKPLAASIVRETTRGTP